MRRRYLFPLVTAILALPVTIPRAEADTYHVDRRIDTSFILTGTLNVPEGNYTFVVLAFSHFFLDRFPEAETILQRAAEHKQENPNLLLVRCNIAVLKGDRDQMDRLSALAKGRTPSRPGRMPFTGRAEMPPDRERPGQSAQC